MHEILIEASPLLADFAALWDSFAMLENFLEMRSKCVLHLLAGTLDLMRGNPSFNQLATNLGKSLGMSHAVFKKVNGSFAMLAATDVVQSMGDFWIDAWTKFLSGFADIDNLEELAANSKRSEEEWNVERAKFVNELSHLPQEQLIVRVKDMKDRAAPRRSLQNLFAKL